VAAWCFFVSLGITDREAAIRIRGTYLDKKKKEREEGRKKKMR